MGMLTGFVLGCIVGARARPEHLEQLRSAWDDVRGSEEFRTFLGTATELLRNRVTQADLQANPQETTGTGARPQAATTGDGNEPDPVRSGELRAAWTQVAASPEAKRLVADGKVLLESLLQRATTTVRSPVEQAAPNGDETTAARPQSPPIAARGTLR